jgi:hypothetical protein
VNWMTEKRDTTKVKGDLIEDLVKRLHESSGYRVESRVRMPSKKNPKRYREIDVLATGIMLGRTMHVAFECKNYGKRIGVPKVGEFRDKLEDVGIPAQHGIMITSANGYTADALDRASELGIKLLVLDGLTDDRLTMAVHEAFQSVVYILLSITKIVITNELPTATWNQLLFLRDPSGQVRGSVMDLVWAEWRDGRLPLDLGTYKVSLDIPLGWHWITGETVTPTSAVVEVATTAYVLNIPGTATHVSLRDAQSGERDRAQVSFDFSKHLPGSFRLSRASTEEELQELLRARGDVHVTVHRIPLPRIVHEYYWPPSERAIARLDRHYRLLIRAGKHDVWNYPLSFRDIEGTDLISMWDPIWAAHPASGDEDWPWT